MHPTLGKEADISLDSCKYEKTEQAIRREENTAEEVTVRCSQENTDVVEEENKQHHEGSKQTAQARPPSMPPLPPQFFQAYLPLCSHGSP